MTEFEKKQAIEGDFKNVGSVHDWRNYINDTVRAIWHTLTEVQRIAIAENAQELADREEWD